MDLGDESSNLWCSRTVRVSGILLVPIGRQHVQAPSDPVTERILQLRHQDMIYVLVPDRHDVYVGCHNSIVSKLICFQPCPDISNHSGEVLVDGSRVQIPVDGGNLSSN